MLPVQAVDGISGRGGRLGGDSDAESKEAEYAFSRLELEQESLSSPSFK
jgi:hypothetical protein